MSQIALNENLIADMARGDAEAFRDLYRASASIVYGYALSILRNRADAEDVMHDAYIRMYRSAASYQPMGKPLAWMLTIVRNLCYNRAGATKPTVDIGDYDSPSPTDEHEATLDRMMLQKALRVLDLQERQIVVLRALTGLKHREIAEALELPMGTVLSKYRRSLKKLRDELEGREHDER